MLFGKWGFKTLSRCDVGQSGLGRALVWVHFRSICSFMMHTVPHMHLPDPSQAMKTAEGTKVRNGRSRNDPSCLQDTPSCASTPERHNTT